MKFTKIALGLLGCCILFCGCTKNTDAVIKINDKVISKAEFYDDYKRIKNVQLKNAPKEIQKDTSYAALSIKNRFVNDVIVRELLAQEFEKRKLTASEEEIKANKEKIIAQVGSLERFNNILKENNISEERLNSDMANEVKIDKLYSELNKNKITDTDALKFYKEHKSDFERPERVKASHILIDTNEEPIKKAIVDADKEGKLSQSEIDKKVKEEVAKAQALAEEVRQKALKNPKNFAQLAKEYSQDKGSAQNGGDLGYIIKEQVVPEFGEMAFSQKVGTVSPLVKSQFGTHIIYVTDKAAAGVQPFGEVKADLKTYLERQQKYETIQKLIEGLKASAKIEYIDSSLNPANLEKEIEKALPKQLEFEQRANAPKSKLKILDKFDKKKEEQK